jgi:hypothetical protein
VSWEQLNSLLRMAVDEHDQNQRQPPQACRHCGWPLNTGPQGQLFCPADGWTWDGGPVTW